MCILGLFEGFATAPGTPPLLLPFIRGSSITPQEFGVSPQEVLHTAGPGVAAAVPYQYIAVQLALPGSGCVEV